MVFVLFSCANPSSDSTSGSQPSNPEEPTYSITFIAEKCPEWDQPVADLLNNLDKYKNLKEGAEVELPTVIYALQGDEYVLEEPELNVSYHTYTIYYEDGEITSVKVGNEDYKIKFWVDD